MLGFGFVFSVLDVENRQHVKGGKLRGDRTAVGPSVEKESIQLNSPSTRK